MVAQSFDQPLVEISVEQLARQMADSPEQLQLIDVRERQEVAIASIEGFEILPLSEFARKHSGDGVDKKGRMSSSVEPWKSNRQLSQIALKLWNCCPNQFYASSGRNFNTQK
ncbi:hypothetical protein [Moorena sp. SIO3F7]|uniref:hypothetical protein n=1 Tax=Moorena sp. SIO3F7 TaxID=2607839 RepID=UPI0026004629|nr:hypothetical protein [Moorena sp. SIO3F7]